MFANRPRSLVCYICGREYGTKSLGIHLKSCIKKWDIEQQKLPKKERRPLPKPPKGLADLLDKKTVTDLDLQQYNNDAFDDYNEKALIKCEYCGRTFGPDA